MPAPASVAESLADDLVTLAGKKCPDTVVTDHLRAYTAAIRDLKLSADHERGRWKNNRAENSHQPTRRRERQMQGFKSLRSAPAFFVDARRRLQPL
jgi:transposase-like protein